MKGRANLELSEPFEAKSVKIKIEGQAMVLIRVYRTTGHYDERATQIFVKDDVKVWEKSEGEKLIPAGKHQFPFQFTLPPQCLGSTPNLLQSRIDFAYIRYRLKMKIDSGKVFSSI